jgi:hypothetical protein
MIESAPMEKKIRFLIQYLFWVLVISITLSVYVNPLVPSTDIQLFRYAGF